MNDYQSLAQVLLSNAPATRSNDAFRLEANQSNILANATFQRHSGTLPEELLGLVVLHTAGKPQSYAALSGTVDALHLQLSNGETHPLQGDLSRSQLANILANLAATNGDVLLEYAVFTQPDNAVLNALETLDTDFYKKYTVQKGVRELFVYDDQVDYATDRRPNPDKCYDCNGGGKRCATYSWKCIH